MAQQYTQDAPELTVVVLAAGLASRYGSAKALAPVGPSGEHLADYALYDARAAGFTRAVFVVRAEHEAAFRAHHRAMPGMLPVRYVRQDSFQPRGFVAPLRDKPWGTGHAVLAAASQIAAGFVVLNADDYYGPESYRRMAAHLRANRSTSQPRFALGGYRLADTLSPAGGVSRAVCRVDRAGRLVHLEEILDVRKSGSALVGREARSGEQRELDGDATICMNMWGFTGALRERLATAFQRFIARHGDDPAAEFLIGPAVQEMIDRDEAAVQVLLSGERCFGMTHAADRDHVTRSLARLVADGRYRSPLA